MNRQVRLSDNLYTDRSVYMSIEKKSPRARILATAGPLFHREGYRAVGIDRIIAQSGVAKASFYHHFPAKDDLIVAFIAASEQHAATALPGPDGAAPLSAYVDALIDIAQTPTCAGCAYQGTAAEFADPTHPAHAASLGVKTRTLEALRLRAERQGLADPNAVAERIFLLLEGVWAVVRMFGDGAPITGAKAAARKLMG